MKSQEELNTIKEEVETLNKKLAELTDEELEHVTGGIKHVHLEIVDESDVAALAREAFRY